MNPLTDRCARCDEPLEPGQPVQWVQGLNVAHRAHTACLGPHGAGDVDQPTPEHQLLDQLITEGIRRDPLTDWCLYVPAEVSLLLPRDPSSASTHRYRGHEVIGFPMTQPLAILSATTAASIYLDLTTGAITDTRPTDTSSPG